MQVETTEWALRKTVRLAQTLARQAPRLGFPRLGREPREIGYLDGRKSCGQDLRDRVALSLHEAHAQRFVAAHQGVERAPQGRLIERPADADAEADVVFRAAGVQAIQEPQPLLRRGYGNAPPRGSRRTPPLEADLASSQRFDQLRFALGDLSLRCGIERALGRVHAQSLAVERQADSAPLQRIQHCSGVVRLGGRAGHFGK